MGKRLSPTALLLLTAALVPSPAEGQVIGSGPITRVAGPAEDRALAWRTQTVWSVPGSAQGMELSRLSSSDLATLSDGRLAVLDRFGHRVYILDSRGRVASMLGRRGRGPGEFSRPANVTLDGAGNLAVLDRDKGAFVRWSPRGELLSEVRGPGFFVGNGASFVQNGFVYKTMRQSQAGSSFELILARSGNASVLARGPHAPLRTSDFPSCNARGITVSPLFAPSMSWAVDGSRIAVAVDDAYEIRIFEDGTELFRITRPVSPRRATRELALRQADGVTFGTCQVSSDEVVRGFGYAEVVPAIADLRFGLNGELWVLRGHVLGEQQRIDIFESTGRYVGTLSGSPFPGTFTGHDGYLAIATDAFDVPVIEHHRLVRR